MTGCEEIRPLISSYVDGEASAEEVSFVQAHLKTCDKCQSHLAFLKLLGPAIDHTPLAAPSPLLFDRIAMATYAKPTWQQRYLGWLAPISLRWTVGSGLVAAGVVAVLVAPRVMQTASVTPETTPVAVNVHRSTEATPPPANIAAKPAPVLATPEVVRPSVAAPASAPVAVKPVEPRTNTRIANSDVAETPAKRVAPAPRSIASVKPKVERTQPTKIAGTVTAPKTKPDTAAPTTVVKPLPVPSPAPKTTVDEPILVAATPDRNSNVSHPGAGAAKTATIAANALNPETPSFNPSAPEPEPVSRKSGFSLEKDALKGANRPPELTAMNLRKPLASGSANITIADADVK